MARQAFMILAYNRVGYLKLCLDSILQLQGIENWDIVLTIDGGGKTEAIKQLAKQYPINRVIERKENVDILKNLTLSLKELFDDYDKIFFIEDDHIFDREYKGEVISYLENIQPKDNTVFISTFHRVDKDRRYYPRGNLIYKHKFNSLFRYLASYLNDSESGKHGWIFEKYCQENELDSIFPEKCYTHHIAPHEDKYEYNLPRYPNYISLVDYILIERYLPFFDGAYVDIGANHWKYRSNTYIFSQFLGWTGIDIEPIPELNQLLKQHRPDDIVLDYVVSNENKENIAFYVNNGSIFNGDSSLNPDWRHESKREKTIEVNSCRMDTLLDKYPIESCDLCSIDVEGYEQAVLKSIDFDEFKPKVFVIESSKVDRPEKFYDTSSKAKYSHELWEDILHDNGYTYSESIPLNEKQADRVYVNETVELLY